MEVYLDNGATTRPRDEVIDKINYMLKECYGNPSSIHRMGFYAEKEVEKARKVIANYLRVCEDEIFFTSGGTESNNLAVQGIIDRYSRYGNHIITTRIEHSSIMNIFEYYEDKGYEVTYLDVDNKGFIDLDELDSSIDDNTILVSIMLVNNEIGTIQPISQVNDILKKKKSKAKLHVDGIQAFGKVDVNLKGWDIDTFSFSGHKVYGPKGIGGLYVKKGALLSPLVYGGNQERGLRSGTENTPGIVGLGKAVEILNNNQESERKKVSEVRKYFIEQVSKNIEDIRINSPINKRVSPYIVSISFLGIRGEVLVHYLEDNGVYVSTSAACSSHKKGKSHVLKSIGLNDEEIEGTIRFSFSYENNKEQIDYAVKKLKESVDEIRQIIMR